MDPDAIFLILLYLVMLGLTIGCIFGLSAKIWQTSAPWGLKIFAIALLVGLLIVALLVFDGVETGERIISRWQLMIYSASFLIGLNWSINLIRKQAFVRIKASNLIKVAALTISFSVLIPTIFYFLANLFDKLNLLGSGG